MVLSIIFAACMIAFLVASGLDYMSTVSTQGKFTPEGWVIREKNRIFRKKDGSFNKLMYIGTAVGCVVPSVLMLIFFQPDSLTNIIAYVGGSVGYLISAFMRFKASRKNWKLLRGK